jgi:hypothetical protein
MEQNRLAGQHAALVGDAISRGPDFDFMETL